MGCAWAWYGLASRTTPHPQPLSPKRGEGSKRCVLGDAEERVREMGRGERERVKQGSVREPAIRGEGSGSSLGEVENGESEWATQNDSCSARMWLRPPTNDVLPSRDYGFLVLIPANTAGGPDQKGSAMPASRNVRDLLLIR
jgi:hypothetical protein